MKYIKKIKTPNDPTQGANTRHSEQDTANKTQDGITRHRKQDTANKTQETRHSEQDTRRDNL